MKVDPIRVYSSDSPLRHPSHFFYDMWQDLINSRELAWRLMIRDISAKYRQSFLGIVWAFLPPIAMAFVFIILNSRKVINIDETNIPYPAFAFMGTILWQVFVDSLNAPLKVVIASKNMLAKINFPKEALILSGIGQSLFDLLIKLFILVFVFIIYKIPFSIGVIYALPVTLVLVLLGTTFGLFFTPIGVLYSDVSQGLGVVTSLWFFLTPVVYPAPTSYPFSLLATLNPVSPVLSGARDLATEGVLHNPIAFFVIFFVMLAVLFITWIVFRLAVPILVERMG